MARRRPLQNRVLPTGEIVAHKARGMFTGNRGILSFKTGRLGISRWKHHHWIICTLTHPRGRYHGPMPDHAWTPLFFLDEAVALAAGHRPCAYCRPDAYRSFKTAWANAFGAQNSHAEMDRALHSARVTRQRQQVRHQADINTLPDGAFVLKDDQPHLVQGDHLLPYKLTGYEAATPQPHQKITVLTPKPMIEVLRAGFTPRLHNSL